MAGIKELEQVVSAYEKKLGDTAKRLADTQAKMDAARTALDEAEGRLTGKWKLDKVILYAEKKEQVGGSFTVWNQQTGIYWKTEILTPTSVTNLGRKYMVVGTFTPPPPLLEPGKPFDVVFQGRFSKSEEDVGWPGVLMDVLEKATIDGKSVNKAVFEVNPKRQNPTDRFTFTAPPAKSLDVWRFGIRAWNTPNFGIVYQYKPLK